MGSVIVTKGREVKDPRIEQVLSSVSIKFRYEADYPLAKLISDEQTQVRFADNIAPKKEVDRYLDLLKAGVVFPPIVVLKDGRIVDGNTRWGAFQRDRKRVTIPAYVLDTSSPAIARRIGVELNAQAGKRMERAELSNWLATGNGSVSEEDARRITGWSKTTISRVRGALQFDARRAKLNVSLQASLPDEVKAYLNNVADPDVFRDLTILADEAGLKRSEVSALVSQVNDVAKTDVQAAREVVSGQRREAALRIQERAAGLRVTTPLYQQMAMHVGWIVKQGPSGLHDSNAYTAPRARALLESAVEVLREAIELY